MVRGTNSNRENSGASSGTVRDPLDSIIGISAAIQQVKAVIRQVAPSDITVLISGESGTGKELVAEAVHHHSPRRNGPLVSPNCGAIPEGIFESEIFGHE
ncbi:MAG TPA: sigma-54-dependent Fis family transcriptional regulator, partial [Bacteroidetes bacterium]|nr:sigma-54-dependent Fis family transcriptional regulator [Bacteroidota bacterium]